jgi:hypothetical protein
MVYGIDRVLFGGEGPLVFEKVFLILPVVMPVGFATAFCGTYSSLTVLSWFNLNSW